MLALITEHDLDSAIAECQGKRNPDAKTCIMLAAFYTIRREMFGEEKDAEPHSYSYAPAPEREVVEFDSDSEFANLIRGRDQNEIWPIMDELMDAVHTLLPRLYNAVLRKLEE